MGANLNFSPTTIWIFVAAVFVMIVAIILIGRFLMNKKSLSGLTNKYKLGKFSSPLKGRNKYPDVDIFQYRGTFLLFGLLITIALLISAFSMTTYKKEIFIPDNALAYEEDIEIEPPRSAEPPPPPPPPPPQVITQVANEIDLEEEDISFVDQSIEENTEVVAPIEKPTPKKKTVAPPPPPPPPPPPETKVEEIFQVVEEMPRFPGCEDVSTKEEKYSCASKKMLEFIYGNIQYPSIAKENNIQGTVVVRFVISESGKVEGTEVVRDIGARCGEEALRVINLMNKNGITWHPGKQRGRAVKVRMNLPVKFKLI